MCFAWNKLKLTISGIAVHTCMTFSESIFTLRLKCVTSCNNTLIRGGTFLFHEKQVLWRPEHKISFDVSLIFPLELSSTPQWLARLHQRKLAESLYCLYKIGTGVSCYRANGMAAAAFAAASHCAVCENESAMPV